jgi:hypothetical protein
MLIFFFFPITQCCHTVKGLKYSQQEAEVAATSVGVVAVMMGFSLRSRAMLRMPLPHGVHAMALGSEYITHPSLKLPRVVVLGHRDRPSADVVST